jgi:flagellar motor switch/type III secretory pathway protein FliN
VVLDADELQALGEAAHSTVPVVAQPRTRPFHLGRSDQDLSRAAAFLDIHVPAILKRVREATRHESGRNVTLAEVTPRLLPVQDLFLGEGASSVVLVEVAAGVGLPPGLMVMNVHSARALALMAISPTSSAIPDTPRPISGTERRLLARCLTSFLKAFERGLPKDTPLLPLRLQHLYNDPRELVGFDKSAPMVTLPISFDGDVSARLEFVIPSSWLVVGRHHGAASHKGSGKRVGHDHSQVILEVSAELGRARVSLRRLLNLSPGDLVLLRTSPHAMVPVLIQGREKLKARPEVRDGRVAMVIANDGARADLGGAGDIADNGTSKDVTPTANGETHG